MDPVTWIYIGAALLGSGIWQGGQAQKKVNENRSRAMTREREDRAAQREKAREALSGTTAEMANLRQNEAMEADRLANEMIGQQRANQPVNPETVQATVQDRDPRVVAATRGASQKATKYTNQQARSLADLLAFGTVARDTARSTMRNAEDIDRFGSYVQGYGRNVLPAELRYADASGASHQALGDILTMAGQMALTYGLSGAGGAGQGAAPGGGGGVAAPTTAPVAGGASAAKPGVLYGNPDLQWMMTTFGAPQKVPPGFR